MEKITLSSEKEVINFTPEIEGDLAVVHISVIQKLASLLISKGLEEILNNHCSEIQRCKTLEVAIKESEEFIAFHKTINLIQNYKKTII